MTETTPFGASHHVWTDEATGEERVGEPITKTPSECPGCGSRGRVHRDWCSDLGANTPTDSSERGG